MRTFAQFLAEKEKTVKLYGLGAKGQSPGKAMASVVRPAKPARPFNGLYAPEIYGKRPKSGVVGN